MKHFGLAALILAIVLFAFIPSTTAFSYDAQLNCELILQQDESVEIQSTVITENVIIERLSYQPIFDVTENKFEQAYLRTVDSRILFYKQKLRAEQFIRSKDYNNKTIGIVWPQTYARRL